VVKIRARIAEERDGAFDPLDDRCVIGGGHDLVAVFVKPPAQEANIGRDVVHDVHDIDFVKVSLARVLDSGVRCLVQPTLEVLEGRLPGTRRKRVVLFAGFPGDPRRPIGTPAIGAIAG
jgi:hypothetical protein